MVIKFLCTLCEKETLGNYNQKYCLDCKNEKKKERSRNYMRKIRSSYPKKEKIVSFKKNYDITCEGCQVNFHASYKNRRFCDKCRYDKRVHSNTVKNIKRYEARLELLELANFTCTICGEQKDPGLLVLDHDHSCCPPARACVKCFRGVLCRSCNTGLGAFKDDPEQLRIAASYLDERKLIQVDIILEISEI